jgi:hypothetical protein
MKISTTTLVKEFPSIFIARLCWCERKNTIFIIVVVVVVDIVAVDMGEQESGRK